jgi:hypothetical protein
MDESLIRLVRERAAETCEYCRLPQTAHPNRFPIDHIISRQHHGPTALGNLALSCLNCNSYKGPNIAGLDPIGRKLTKLFNPRRHKWDRHFRWQGPVLIGRTAVGRVTIDVLNMNHPEVVELREALIDEGRFPVFP